MASGILVSFRSAGEGEQVMLRRVRVGAEDTRGFIDPSLTRL